MKTLKKIIAALLLVFILTGCAGAKQYTAYTIYPVGYLLDRICGNTITKASIQNNTLVQVAQINEDYQPVLEDSVVFFHIGELEPYMSLFEDDIYNTGVKQVDLSVLNAVYRFQRYSLVYVDGKNTYVEGPFYDSDLFEEIDTDQLDLFLWLDPIGMLSMGKDIMEYFASNYVEEAETFRSNYKVLEEELIALDASYQNLSQKLRNEQMILKFVSMTPSFSNWQKDYGFQIYPVCLSKYGALPSAQELEIIKERIKADGVEYIAWEPNLSSEMSQLFDQLVSELGLKRITLNNISSLTNTQIQEGKDYMSLMYENLSTLEGVVNSMIEAKNAPVEE